jgi:hypothetical protein
MQSDNSILIEKFESEALLYIDKLLDAEKMKYWDEQISRSSELRGALNETLKVMNIYNAQSLHDIAEPEFEKMIQKAAKRKGITRQIADKLFGFSFGDSEMRINSSKIAFGSLLVIASIVMLLLTDKPNKVKEIGNDLLDWEATSLNEQMEEIEGRISLIEDDNLKQYMLYKMTKDEWMRDYYKIENDMQKLINETENRSL